MALWACENNNDEVRIRLDNQTGEDFATVYVNSGGNDNDYEALPTGEKSDYLTYEAAYRYGYVRAITPDQDTFIVQPIDYVGESLLEPGHYTYLLTLADPSSPWMGIELVED